MIQKSLISIIQFSNSYFESNTFIVQSESKKILAIVDPGELNATRLLDFLSDKKSKIFNVILTHEHYDHICGLIALCSWYKIKIFLSKKCYEI